MKKTQKPKTKGHNGRRPSGWKNRIVGHGERPANQFNFNPLNYRQHPEDQRDAVRKMLGMIGWVDEVLVNKRTGNLIDGQARIEEALKQDPEQLIPYAEVDLTLAEEKAVLATFDPMTGMAETNPEILEQLIQDVTSTIPDLDELLQSLHNEEPPAKERTVQFKEHIRLVIECKNRTQQKKLLKRFESEGLEVRAT